LSKLQKFLNSMSLVNQNNGAFYSKRHNTTEQIYATCTSPIMKVICPPKFYITFVFHFPWALQLLQEKLKQCLYKILGGKSCVLWEICKLGTLSPNHIIIFLILLLRKFIALLTWLLSQSDEREGENTFQQSVQSTPGNLNPL